MPETVQDTIRALEERLTLLELNRLNYPLDPVSQSVLKREVQGTLDNILVLKGGQTKYNTGVGFFLGNESGAYKLSIGNPAGNYLTWDGTTLTLAGGITATSGTIGGFSIGADYLRDAANSFGLASTVSGGDDVRFWAGAAFADRATAPFRVTEAGAVTGSSITITGGAVSGVPISSIPNSTVTDISLLECSHDLVFSVTDADTIAWATGTIVFSNGRTFTIDAGNTGNMAALTYIYLDPAVSSTVLQVTTTYSTAMGANKRLIGTAQNHTVTASFIPYGAGVPLIDGANIGALSIVAGNIAASTITSGKLSVSQLSAIAADLGAITAGTVTLDTAGYVRGGQTDFNTGTGFFLGYSGAAYKFSVGNPAGNYISWDGTTLVIIGNQVVITTYTSGSGNWTKATGTKSVFVQAWGGGGAGGGRNDSSRFAGGGAGGAYVEHLFNAADLGATEAYAVGAGGTGGTGSGPAGANTTFDILIAGGGGGGVGGGIGTGGGGGGGGSASVGASGSTTTGGDGGIPLKGTGGAADVDGTTSVFGGGGGGGGSSSAVSDGGESVMGGGGAGGGGNGINGGVGGNSWKGGAGGGGGSSAVAGNGGTSIYGGNGGAGGVNANGTDGTAPGGGGGGGASTATNRNGGSGGSGKLTITEYL